MEIKLAKTAGFCMGVRRAVDTVLDVSQHETGRKIYTYGPLIHNPQTIELLKNRGITAIQSIDEIPDRRNALLVIRAHGIAPGERKIKESGVKIIDATCPKVGYVQAIIKKHTALDYTVIIAGDREHPEVDGLWGYTEGRGIIVSTLEDAEKIPALDKVCIVAQTTQDSDHYREIVRKIQEKIRGPSFSTRSAPPRRSGRKKLFPWPRKWTLSLSSEEKTARTPADWPTWPESKTRRRFTSKPSKN